MQELSNLLSYYRDNPNFQNRYREHVEEVINHPLVREYIESHTEDVSREMVENSLTKLNEFVQEKSALNQGETGSNPGYEPELVIHGDYIDIEYRPTEAYLKQLSQQQFNHRLDNHMMAEENRSATMDQIQATPARIEILSAMQTFLETYETNPSQARGMYLCGKFGVGKTYMLSALAHKLATKGHEVAMIYYITLIKELKEGMQDNRMAGRLDEVMNVEILILDDIGAESNSQWIRDDVLLPIVEHRMKLNLPTFFTSNFTMDELEAHLAMTNRGHQEPIKARRIMERIRYLSREYVLDGQNLRMR